MESYRRCEACKHHQTKSTATHPYLKRRSTNISATASTTTHSCESTSSETETGFSNIDSCMSEARAKYAAHPHLHIEETSLPGFVPTPDDMDFNERLDAALSKTEALLVEAKTPLTAPCVTTPELTYAEETERRVAAKWTEAYKNINEVADGASNRVEKLAGKVLALVNDSAASNAALLVDSQAPGTPVTFDIGSFTPVKASELRTESDIFMDETRAKQMKHSPIYVSTAADAAGQTYETSATAPTQTASGMTPAASKSSKPVTNPANGSARSNAQQQNNRWQTLWSCDYKVSW